MRLLYRCSNVRCRKRRVLSKPLSHYVRAPKCYGCGGRKLFHDRWQERKNANSLCWCSGYWWVTNRGPHRRGSKWCEHNSSPVSLQELAEHYNCHPHEVLNHPRYQPTPEERLSDYLNNIPQQPEEDAIPW